MCRHCPTRPTHSYQFILQVVTTELGDESGWQYIRLFNVTPNLFIFNKFIKSELIQLISIVLLGELRNTQAHLSVV